MDGRCHKKILFGLRLLLNLLFRLSLGVLFVGLGFSWLLLPTYVKTVPRRKERVEKLVYSALRHDIRHNSYDIRHVYISFSQKYNNQ